MLSGVPQGSVLGRNLFLAYTNDLPGSVRSRVLLFADDTIVFLTIKSHASTQSSARLTQSRTLEKRMVNGI